MFNFLRFCILCVGLYIVGLGAYVLTLEVIQHKALREFEMDKNKYTYLFEKTCCDNCKKEWK